MINPDKQNWKSLCQYRFLGRIIGIALRSSVQIHLSLPNVFWKQLTYYIQQHNKCLKNLNLKHTNENFESDLKNLAEFDSSTAQFLRELVKLVYSMKHFDF